MVRHEILEMLHRVGWLCANQVAAVHVQIRVL